MKTAIIYYSKHGTTAKVARIIGENSGLEPEYISLKEQHNPDIRNYDKIILGTSIHMGRPGSLMSIFCKNNLSSLEQKAVGLFICCMNEANETEQLKNAFPEYLNVAVNIKAVLGGEFLFDKMNFIERFVTRKVSKVKSSVSRLRYDDINKFVEKIKTGCTEEYLPL